MKMLITGSTGFIGMSLVEFLISQDLDVVAAVRKISKTLPVQIQQEKIGDLQPNTDWGKPLCGVDVVIHLAARVHVMNDSASDPLEEFRKTNTAATLNLARQAAMSGVGRFIYLSSIKVNGECTKLAQPFLPDDSHIPTDPYGLSKYEAEQGLKNIAEQTGMEVVIIRPPLVYGPNVKANFNNMMSWLYKGIPLPLGSINNRRSLVALDNLVDLIFVCINHPAAANQVFLVSDDEDLSTTELLERTAIALGKPSRLISIPSQVIVRGATLLGKGDVAQRLCGSLQVDISHTKNMLGWNPAIGVDEALRKTAGAYLELLK